MKLLNIDWKSRLRNKYFIVPMLALVGLVAQTKYHIAPADWETFAASLVALLVAAGIIIDPTSPGVGDRAE